MRRKFLRQIALRRRNTLVKYAMLMAMELTSFCLDNDSAEDQVLNKTNRDLYMELFERILRAIQLDTRYIKKIKCYDVSDIITCDDLLDHIQFSYPEIIRSIKYSEESFNLDEVKHNLEAYESVLTKCRELYIKIK